MRRTCLTTHSLRVSFFSKPWVNSCHSRALPTVRPLRLFCAPNVYICLIVVKCFERLHRGRPHQYASRRAVSQFYTQMNEVQVDLHNEKIPNSDKTTKTAAAKTVQDSWDKAASIVQNLRELRDTLQNKESEAVYNYQMNDGVWKNGQALQDVDQPLRTVSCVWTRPVSWPCSRSSSSVAR